MISFSVDTLFLLDLRDDFLMNRSENLYEFIGKDPVKAFHLGINIKKWFNDLEKDQQYLYSKLLRHNFEEIQPYSEQLQFWASKYPAPSEEEVDLIKVSEFMFNSMIWDKKTSDKEKIKVALFLGLNIASKDPQNQLQDEQK